MPWDFVVLSSESMPPCPIWRRASILFCLLLPLLSVVSLAHDLICKDVLTVPMLVLMKETDCIGTFSIVGPVLSALSPSQGWAIGESANTFLYTNATLDLVTSTVLAASFGRIMLWAAPVLFCWQGMFYAIGYFCGDGMPEPMRVELSIVGGVLIVSSGLGILGIKDCKTVNLLPSLLVPVGFYLVKMIIE